MDQNGTVIEETEINVSSLQNPSLTFKIRKRIIPLVFLMYLIALMDRANLANAHSDLAKDLKLTGTINIKNSQIVESQFGLGIGVFFIGYVLAEIPSNIILERWNPRLIEF